MIMFAPVHHINSPVREHHVEDEDSSNGSVSMGEGKAIDDIGV